MTSCGEYITKSQLPGGEYTGRADYKYEQLRKFCKSRKSNILDISIGTWKSCLVEKDEKISRLCLFNNILTTFQTMTKNYYIYIFFHTRYLLQFWAVGVPIKRVLSAQVWNIWAKVCSQRTRHQTTPLASYCIYSRQTGTRQTIVFWKCPPKDYAYTTITIQYTCQAV
jgi:hypothetical protein